MQFNVALNEYELRSAQWRPIFEFSDRFSVDPNFEIFLMGADSDVKFLALFKRRPVALFFAPLGSLAVIHNDFSFVQSIRHVKNNIAAFDVFARRQIDFESAFRYDKSFYDYRLARIQLTLDSPYIRYRPTLLSSAHFLQCVEKFRSKIKTKMKISMKIQN